MVKIFRYWFMLCAVMMLSAVCFSACGDDDKDEPVSPTQANLVGTWVSTKIVSLQGPGAGTDTSDYSKYTFVFKNDGTYTADFEAHDLEEGWEGDDQIGSYSIEGKELVMTRVLFGTVIGPFNMYTIDKLTDNTLVLLAKDYTSQGSNTRYTMSITFKRQ